MKKLLIMFLAIILCLSMFAGCESETLSEDSNAKEIASGDFTIEKIEVVAYAGGSLATCDYDYLVTVKNEDISILLCATVEHYMTWNTNDVISGKLYELDTVTTYDDLKFVFADSNETISCVAYLRHD